MYHADLGVLLQKLRDNVNGMAQDRLLLCEIHKQLINHGDIKNHRFHEMFIKFTRPHQDAFIQHYERKQDLSITQSKHKLLHAWEACQCFTEICNLKEDTDAKKMYSLLSSLRQLIEEGDFNVVLTPDELIAIKNIADGYTVGNGSTHTQQKINTDFESAITFIERLA